MNQISSQTIGASMRSCRRSRHISRRLLSCMADVPYSTLTRAEQGACFMSLYSLCACARALNISLDEYTGFNNDLKGGSAICSTTAR